ncbi:hypothetical protein Pelo_19938 [Pelomyxa schiedti]|nr:hypothetical protein Pelo_19938 [Pelomyxa schiedti]
MSIPQPAATLVPGAKCSLDSESLTRLLAATPAIGLNSEDVLATEPTNALVVHCDTNRATNHPKRPTHTEEIVVLDPIIAVRGDHEGFITHRFPPQSTTTHNGNTATPQR